MPYSLSVKPRVSGTRVDGFVSGDAYIENLVPVPWGPYNIRYCTRGYNLPPLTTNGVTSAWYCRPDYSLSQQAYGIVGEVSASQQDTWGSFLWINHRGLGDAAYISCFNTGAGLEVAGFCNGTRNIISTIQTADCANSVCYIALWEQDVTPNYGLFLGQESYAKAFIAQKRVNSVDGGHQFGVAEHDYATWRWRLLNDGGSIQESLAASAGTLKRNSPEMRLRGAYWNGASSASLDCLVKLVVEDDSPLAYAAYFYVGPPGSETLACCYRPGALDMQLNTIQNVRYIDGYTGNVTIRSNAGGTELLDLELAPADGNTGMLLITRQGAVISKQQVKLDVAVGGKRNLYVDEIV